MCPLFILITPNNLKSANLILMVLMFVSFVYSTDTVKKVTEKAVADYFANLGLGMVWILYLRVCTVLFMFS